jgi:hypothetical protein
MYFRGFMKVDFLYLWYLALAILIGLPLLCCYGGAVCLEESGTATGTGSHTMEIQMPGNQTTEEATVMLAMRGYNVTRAGYVTLNGTTWHVIA